MNNEKQIKEILSQTHKALEFIHMVGFRSCFWAVYDANDPKTHALFKKIINGQIDNKYSYEYKQTLETVRCKTQHLFEDLFSDLAWEQKRNYGLPISQDELERIDNLINRLKQEHTARILDNK